MPRDLQILLLYLATLAGIGAYVLLDGKDLDVRSGQSAIRFPAPEAAAAPEAPPLEPAATVAGGRCVEMRFLDDKGIIVPVSPPITGIVIGGTPLFEGSPPPFAEMEAGRIVPCPQALIESVRKTFDDFCTSGDRRKKTAAENGVDMDTVNRRCADMSAALAR
jgi:hypothetical protein